MLERGDRPFARGDQKISALVGKSGTLPQAGTCDGLGALARIKPPLGEGLFVSIIGLALPPAHLPAIL